MIDWTKPVKCARGLDAEPLLDANGSVLACQVGSVVYSCSAFGKLGLRNVAPPRPEPVQHEVWISLYANGGTVTLTNNAHPALGYEPVQCRRIAWMSDGSPPGEDDPVRYGVCETCVEKAVKRCDELIVERDAWIETARQHARNEEYYTGLIDTVAPMLGSAMYTQDDGGVVPEPLRACLPKAVAQLAAERDEAREAVKRCDELIVERDALRLDLESRIQESNETRKVIAALTAERDKWRDNANDALDELKAANDRIEQLSPVVEAAVAMPENGSMDPLAGLARVQSVWRTVRTYQSAGPVKNCKTCRWRDSQAIACRDLRGCRGTSNNYSAWETK